MPVGMPSVGHYHPFPEISANIQEIATLSEILDPAHNSHSQIWSSASVGQSCVHSWLSVWIAITAHDRFCPHLMEDIIHRLHPHIMDGVIYHCAPTPLHCSDPLVIDSAHLG